MAVRPIDANELLGIERLLDTDVVRQSKTASWLLNQVLHDIQAMPTLTPPTPAPPCYQPDGDGCGYQCYDGDDEPIDKCKECPLCYSDKQRHHTPPNEPEYREYTCPNCHHTWLEDRDATDYPEYCPGCGEPLNRRAAEGEEDT